MLRIRPGPPFALLTVEVAHVADVDTPRDELLARPSMSWTTRCVPRLEPGSASVIPIPTVIEQAEPGGVICTTRNVSLGWWSTSSEKPSFSV